MNKIRSERRHVTIYNRNTKCTRDCHEKLYTNKLDNLQEMDKLLEMYSLSELNHEK